MFPSANADLRRCFFVLENKDIYICWIILMVYDSVSFVLMAIPALRAYRVGGSSNFVKVVYCDGVIYYTLIFRTNQFSRPVRELGMD
ncbi:hypothetical protein PM082_024715 [Marasmius tenuissimus]|nr:hypothetical protein PM082_024715 [Marasmius tenuissimus]